MEYLNEQAKGYDVKLTNVSSELAAVALQGPNSQKLLEQIVTSGTVPCGSSKNAIGVVELDGRTVVASATGYTGEPIGYELYIKSEDAVYFWNRFVELGAVPAGLGARDTLRLEAALPLYGHEMGIDNYGNEIRLFSVPLASFAVKFAEEKGNYVGREVLEAQYADFLRQKDGDHTDCKALPLRIRPICLTGKGVLRAGFPVMKDGVEVGYVTSGTMVPYYVMDGDIQTDTVAKRSIGFALLREDIVAGDTISVDIRGRAVDAVVVAKHINNRVPPVAIPVVYGE
jgi:aminomethyltransferase